MNKLLIIDFYNLMHRAFHAYPQTFETSDGKHTNAVYGFTNLLLTYLKKVEPTHIVMAYEDDEEPTFRSTEFAGYKKNRTWAEDHPEEAEIFYEQVPYVLDVVEAFNIPYVKCNGYEADDVAGALAKKAPKDTEVIILSNDNDLLQLTEISNVKMLRPARPPYIKEKLFDSKDVVDKYGFGPTKIPDYKGLRGDPSDNIPGVKGVGKKTAKSLLKNFESLENIYENIDKVESTRAKNALSKQPEEAVMSKRLATIDTECPVDFELETYEVKDFDLNKVLEVFDMFEFESLKKKAEKMFGDDKHSEEENSSDSAVQPKLF